MMDLLVMFWGGFREPQTHDICSSPHGVMTIWIRKVEQF